MIKHIVWWTLKDGISVEDTAKQMNILANSLLGKIEGLEAIEVSTNFINSSTEKPHIILQSVHSSKEALSLYYPHPEHAKVGEFIKPLVASRNAIDYEI